MTNDFYIGELYKCQTAGYYATILNKLTSLTYEVCIWSVYTHNWTFATGTICKSLNPDIPSHLLCNGFPELILIKSDAVLEGQARALFVQMVSKYDNLKSAGHSC